MHLIQRQSKATLRSAHTDAIKGSFVESPCFKCQIFSKFSPAAGKFSKFSPAAGKIGQAEKPSLGMPANGLSHLPEGTPGLWVVSGKFSSILHVHVF